MPISRPLHRTWAMEPNNVFLDGRVDITGITGAIAATSETPGVIVTRTNTGKYDFTLSGGASVGRLTGHFQIATGDPTATVPSAYITARSADTLEMTFADSTGNPVDPADGDEIHYLLISRNSSVRTPQQS